MQRRFSVIFDVYQRNLQKFLINFSLHFLNDHKNESVTFPVNSIMGFKSSWINYQEILLYTFPNLGLLSKHIDIAATSRSS